ncbi:kinase-like domain-containing protein [Mycotypha africana]|uniref:kinase-like domain-containing protein n=1 Tax=Mycotypha africana TaxID=64632 RepID=UPI002301E7FD|nr:kinase-like domain-containing protein [Mycotypha africana]KAI8975374.1 kinase-like domain-containing protein [Mycotypha africana]
MTVQLCDTFQKRNPQFKYNTANNPKRVLTKPSEPKKNYGFDNEKSDLILHVNDNLGPDSEKRYTVIELLGAGTFGQVVKCKNLQTNELVAIKIIKNKPAYTNQGSIEVDILNQLNTVHDPTDKYNVLRMYESFMHRNHLCIVFELLALNLYELIKQNHFKGLSTNLVRAFASQILEALSIAKEAEIIHCDLKPENILLKNLTSPAIKVIDFGSACHETEQSYTYIQSRFYRSPEVLLGLRYTTAIDMWSFGCVVAELFLGLPLFPGSSEYNQLTRIIETVGELPTYMIENGKHGRRYYNRELISFNGNMNVYQYYLKDMHQYMEERRRDEKPSKRYFSTYKLDELILKYPLPKKETTAADTKKEMKLRKWLLDFLKRVLQPDPLKRLTPEQALQHPFITGQDYNDDETTVFPTVSAPSRYLRKPNDSNKEEEAHNTLGDEDKTEGEFDTEDDEEIPELLTGVRRKSYADNMQRSSTSVSPYSRKRYESIVTPLLSPPAEKDDKLCQISNQDSAFYYQVQQQQQQQQR